MMKTDKHQNSEELNSDELLFNNLVWLTSKEAAFYLRKTVGAIRVMVCRGQIKAYKFRRRLYFKRNDLNRLIEGSIYKGGFNGSY